MATFKDTLAILITGDAKQFVAEVEKAGAAAETNMNKGGKAATNMGDTFVKTGAIMVGVGAVAAVGIMKTVSAAHEAEQAQLKLENSVKHGKDQLPGAVARYEDLAKSIQNVTVVSDEEVKGAIAMLVQFGLTEGQVRKLTPLVVDLSEKMGVPLPAAAKAVGKAVEGTSGGLARMGIILDKNAFASDHFGTVFDALSGKVGGFAKQEGATFEGQLARIGNKFHDLEESIGRGATPVLETFVGILGHAVDGIGALDESTGNAVGKFAAIGTIGLIATGSVLLLAGGVQKLTLAMTEGALAGTAMGTAVQVAAGGFAGLALATAAHSAIDAYWNSINEPADEARKKIVQFGGDGAKAVKEFDQAVQSKHQGLFHDLLGGGGSPSQLLGDWKHTFGVISDTGAQFKREVLAQFDAIVKASPSVAKALLDSIKADPKEAKQYGYLLDNMQASIDKNVSGRAKAAHAAQDDAEMLKRASDATGTDEEKTKALTDALDAAQKEMDTAANKTKEYADATFAAYDSSFALEDAQRNLKDAMKETVDKTHDAAQVQEDHAKAILEVTRAAEENAVQQLGPAATASQKTKAANDAQLFALQALKAEYPQLGPTIDEMTLKLQANINKSRESASTNDNAKGVLEALRAKYPQLGPEIDKLVAKLDGLKASQAGSNASMDTARGVLDALYAKYPALRDEIDKLRGAIDRLPSGQKSLDYSVNTHFITTGDGTVAGIITGGGHFLRQRGGPIPGNPNDAVPIIAHGGEYVLSADVVEGIKRGQQSAGRKTADVVPISAQQPASGNGGTTIINHNYYLNLTAIDGRSMQRLLLDTLADHVRAQGQGQLQRIIGVPQT